MNKDKQKESEFLTKVKGGHFNFSYSSLNRLRFSPSLFYKDYILLDREVRTDKHLIEGRLVHLLLLQPDVFDEQFILLPGKTPSDAVRRVLNEVKDNLPGIRNSGDPEVEQNYEEPKLDRLQPEIIAALKHQNLYQSIKSDQKKYEKIATIYNQDYFTFLCSADGKDIIDQDTFDNCEHRVNLIKENESIMKLLDVEVTDFELDSVEVHTEKMLSCKLDSFDFGLKGIIDRYMVDHEKKLITIIDIKTTSKSIIDFADTVEFYNYWLQAAIYTMLVVKNLEEKAQDYKISFNFIVTDRYNQIYNFEVRPNTLNEWGMKLRDNLNVAKYHVDNMNFDLPYEFLTNKVSL